MVCGGLAGPDITDACYEYDPMSDTWAQVGAMSEPLEFRGTASHPSLGMVAVGGLPSTSAAESTLDGVTFTSLPDLPVREYHNCLVALSDGSLVSIGGEASLATDNKVYRLPMGAEQWEELPETIYQRSGSSCGVTTDADGREVIVVAGGDNRQPRENQKPLLYED